MLPQLEKEYFLRTNLAEKPPKISDNDIAICCPLCREGKSWNKKQRCHLYYDKNLNKPLVKCFNCGFTGILSTYLKEYNSALYNEYRLEKRKQWLKELQSKRIDIDIDKISTIKNENQFILFDIPKQFIKAKDIIEGFSYLVDRRIEPKFWDLFYYCKEDIKINDKVLPIKDSIIIPLMYENKLYGFQARKINEKRFYTYLPNSGLKVWNWFNIDKDKPIFIFEGVFDALSSGLPLNRICANLGINFPQNLLDQITPIFVLDNQNIDEASRKQSLEYIDNYYVFIWPKYWNGKKIVEKDLNELLLNNWHIDEIREMILQNIETGFKGKLKLKLL